MTDESVFLTDVLATLESLATAISHLDAAVRLRLERADQPPLRLVSPSEVRVEQLRG